MDETPEQPSSPADLVAVILAAGMGTRMRSARHKILHHVAGDPMIFHILDSLAGVGIARPLVVVGHLADQVRSAVGERAQYVVQEPLLGTGHALQEAIRALDSVPKRLLVLCGDTPLIRTSTINRMISSLDVGLAMVLLTARVGDPSGYGRVVRDARGRVAAVVEEGDASDAERAIDEINSGLYCFDGPWLAANLDRIRRSSKGEYYLTEMVALAIEQGREVAAVEAEDPHEVMGINDRVQLAEVDRIMRQRICLSLMANGVTIVDPLHSYVGKGVKVGPDTVIHPGTHLRGRTTIGSGCEIGPNSVIVDSTIGDECLVFASVVEGSEVGDRVSIGPFSHLRPGSRVGSDARLGNYAEVKNSNIGEGVQMHHFSYMGDADVGAGTNIGAGTITCNFDGKQKHRTRIGRHVFLGSDTMLRAPVEVGDGAVTGAGSVVTRDVAPGEVVFGVPARPRGRAE